MIKLILAIFLILFIAYKIKRLIVNEKIYNIRINWIYQKDPRIDKYSYEDMLKHKKFKNLFGFKTPKDSDFK